MDKSKVDKILLPVPAAKTRARDKKVREQFWSKLRTFAAHIPFSEDLAAAYFCATDSNTPLKVRGTLLAALAYFIMPADVLPDFIAVVGFTDDFAVLSTAFTLIRTHMRPEHREQAKAALQREREREEALKD